MALKGAAFVSLPQDADDAPVSIISVTKSTSPVRSRCTSGFIMAAEQIRQANYQCACWSRGSDDATVAALHQLLEQTTLPVVETFQGAGDFTS